MSEKQLAALQMELTALCERHGFAAAAFTYLLDNDRVGVLTVTKATPRNGTFERAMADLFEDWLETPY